MNGEFEAIAEIEAGLAKPPADEIWIGDDTAVLRRPDSPFLLLCADAVVAGVHADLTLTGLDDLGWKSLAANVSDVAAMGGVPGYAVVTVAGPPGTDLNLLYQGIGAAADTYRCPVVGGDLANSDSLVVSVAVTGTVNGRPVTRAGARPGDEIWVTGPLGRSAAGLRLYQSPDDPAASAPGSDSLRRAHARPQAQVAEGTAARLAGATAMMDVSDGFAADLGRIADASGVGFELETVPVAEGATEDEALGGGEDYVLIFCVPPDAPLDQHFRPLPAPIRVGTCVADRAVRTLRGLPLLPAGWEHTW